MTFRESEFPNMVSQIDSILKRYPPAAVAAYAEEMLRIYRAIPLYPGLVCMCMGKAFEKWDPKNPPPAKGSFVVIRLKVRGIVAGTILSWTSKGVQIEFRDPFGELRRTRLPQKRIDEVERFRRDTLESFWPTLVFDRKPHSRRKAGRK